MKSKRLLACTGVVITFTACGPGPGLGLGPALDPIGSLVLIVVFLLGGYWVVRFAVNSPRAQAIGKQISTIGKVDADTAKQTSFPTAEEILRERYAHGEIDRKQFLEMMDDLRKR